MKKMTTLFLILLFVFSGTAFSQHRLESSLNYYRAGDVLVKQQVEYRDPGRSGADVLWDFSRLSPVNEEYKLAYTLTPRCFIEDEYEELPDSCTFLTGSEHRTRYNYTLEGDSLLLWGFRNSTTLIENSQPELLLRFPVAYRDSVKQHYYGHGKYGNRLELDAMGTTETVADSYGMMILPNQDTLRHVLRTRTLKVIAEDTRPMTPWYSEKHAHPPVISSDSIDYRVATDSVLFIVETFRWYEQGYRYPVFETVRSWEQHNNNPDYEFLATAFFYPPDSHEYLEDDAANLAVLDQMQEGLGAEGEIIDPWEGLTYNIYPNPVKDHMEIELYLPRAVTNLRIQMRSTMGTILIEEQQGAYPIGTCSFRFDTYSLAYGNYILDIWLDEKLINQVIMKR